MIGVMTRRPGWMRSGARGAGRHARLGATLEGLDDDHAAAATGTGLRERRHLAVIGIGGFSFWRDGAEQLAGLGDVADASTVGEQTVMTDTVEAVREGVDEAAANELIRWAQFSQRATWPPSAAVRQRSIADITLSWPRLT